MSLLMSMAVPILAAIYTYNYGRWAARKGLGPGAAGLYLLSFLTVVVPAYVFWFVS